MGVHTIIKHDTTCAPLWRVEKKEVYCCVLLGLLLYIFLNIFLFCCCSERACVCAHHLRAE